MPAAEGEQEHTTMARRAAVDRMRRQRRGAQAALLCCALIVLAAAAADAVTATARVRAASVKQRPAAARPKPEELRAKHAAVWPPRLTSTERADIMLPEAMKSRALLEASHGARRKLQVRARLLRTPLILLKSSCKRASCVLGVCNKLCAMSIGCWNVSWTPQVIATEVESLANLIVV